MAVQVGGSRHAEAGEDVTTTDALSLYALHLFWTVYQSLPLLALMCGCLVGPLLLDGVERVYARLANKELR